MEKEELDELAKKHDKNWEEVMKIARKNGFIVQAYGGVATIITNKEQINSYGYLEYERIQKMNSSLEKTNEEEL